MLCSYNYRYIKVVFLEFYVFYFNRNLYEWVIQGNKYNVILIDNLVDFFDEVGGWKVCELRGDSFKVINSFIVGIFQFVYFLLYKYFGGIG